MRRLAEMTLVEFKLLLRDPLTVVFVLVLPVAVLLILNGIFGNVPDEYFGGFGAVDFYTPAYVALVVATIGVLALPVQMAGYREKGVLRRFRASPMPLTLLLAAQVLVAVIIGTVAAGVLVVLSILGYGGSAPADWFQFGAAFVLVTVAFASLGVLLGVLLPTARAAQGVGVLLFFLFMNLGGAGPPPELLPDLMGTIGAFVPVTPAGDLLRGLWFDVGWDVTAAITMTAIVGVGLLVSVWRLQRE